MVVGPVDAPGLDDHAGEPLLGDQPLGEAMRLDLGLLVVGRVAGARVLVALVDDLALGVAEGADG